MISSFFSNLGMLASGNVPLLMLLLKATTILVAAIGITLAMQRASAGARHLVWLVTLGALLLVPALATWAPLRLRILPPVVASVTPDDANAPSPRSAPPAAAAANFLRAPDGGITRIPVADVPVSARTSSSVVTSVRAMSTVSILVAIWLAVLLAIVASLMWAGFSVRRIVRHASPLESEAWRTPLLEVADRLGLQELPLLLKSDEAKMPFACGMLHPTIVFPAECETWSLDRRHAVLLHELAHVRRHDLFGHTLGRLACAVYWFHPLVWTAAKHLRSESERACDDLALSCGTRASEYAEHLLEIVTSVRGDATPSVALAMARRKEFEGRMLAILDPELRHSTPSRRQSAALIGSLALIAVVVSAASPAPRAARAAEVGTRPMARAAPAVPADTDVLDMSPDMRALEADSDAKELLKGGPKAALYAGGGGGGGDKEMSFRQETTTVFTKSTATSTATSEVSPPAPLSPKASPAPLAKATRPPSTAEEALNVIASRSIHIGLNAAKTALETFGQEMTSKGEKGDKGAKNPDERADLLAKVLRSDTSASLRRIAAWGLQEYADTPVGADALANAVKRDADAKVREMAAWALGSSDERAAGTDALVAALKGDSNERVRMTAAWALGNIGDKSSVSSLVSALNDASPEVRTRAAWAIGNIGPKQAPKALVALLGDKDTRTRRLAAWALYNIEDPSTAPAIEAALKVEQDKDVQLDMIRAIAAMGEKSVDAIRGLLESSDPRVKQMAVRALAGGHATGPWPMPWPEPRPFP